MEPHAVGAAADAGRRSDDAGNRSFTEVLQASQAFKKVDIPIHQPAFTDKGDSACFFSTKEIDISLIPVKFSVVAKTPYGRPAFPEIRNHVQKRCGLAGSFVISSLDQYHLLFRFVLEDDFLRVLLRESLSVMGKPFKFFKWTHLFRPAEDPSVVPVWIDFPGLPINLYQEAFIRSIACNIGPVLQVARDTINLINTQAARVCVEVDLLKPRKERIWIGLGDHGYWQGIIYPRLPTYCTLCKKVGSFANSCSCTNKKDSHGPIVPNTTTNADVVSIPVVTTIAPSRPKPTSSTWQRVTNRKDKHKEVVEAHVIPGSLNQFHDIPSTSNQFHVLAESTTHGVEGASGEKQSPHVLPLQPLEEEEANQETGDMACTASHGICPSADVRASSVRDGASAEDVVPKESIIGAVEPENVAAGDDPLSSPQIEQVRTYIDALRTSQSSAGVVDKDDVSSSSGVRKMISRPSRRGGVRICLPVPRVRSPSPPPPAANYLTQINMEAARAVADQARAENIFMPDFKFQCDESDDRDDDEDIFDVIDERCRKRPGLRPRGVLRRSKSWDDFSLEF